MKKSLLFLSLVGIVAGIQNANAEISASATDNIAKVNLLKKLTIAKGNNLNFGNIAFDNEEGSVVLSSAGATSGLTHLTLGENTTEYTRGPGSVTINGPINSTVTVTLPTTDLQLGTGVKVSNFSSADLSDFSSTNGQGTVALGTTGTKTVNIGGKLNVTGSSASAGAQTGTYTVSVSY